jgi:inactive STAND/Effector-associated domain 9
MQDESINQNLISIKKKRLNSLVKQYEAAYNQLSSTLNATDTVIINNQIKDLETEINKLESEIDNLKLRSHQIDSSKFHSQYLRNWKEKFPEIDFEKTNQILESTFKKFKNQEGAALFLLQNSSSMGGNLCIKNIKSKLQGMGSWYPPHKYEFSSLQEANIIGFLNSLAQSFPVQHCDNIPTYTDEIINKIYASLSSGDIFLIEIDIRDLNSQHIVLDWFVQQFWCKLLGRLPEISQKKRFIRFVAVLSIRGSIPKDLLSDLCCKSNKFDSKKFLDLPLKKWTDKEIKNWLFNFSGLGAPPIGVTPQQIERMAENIYLDANKGEPYGVYNKLIAEMSEVVIQFCKEIENYGTKY